MRFRLFIYSLCFALFFSCSKKETDNAGVKHITFSATVNAQLNFDTKAVDGTAFGVGEHSLGIYVCDSEQSPSYLYPVFEEYGNCEAVYTLYDDSQEDWRFYGGGRQWANWIAVDNGTPVDIYSYHPWIEGLSDLTAIPFETGGVDYMWCEPVSLTSSQTSGDGEVNVNLNYRHLLTCVEIAVKANVNDAIMLNSISLKDVTGANIPSKGTFNATNGEVAIADSDKIESVSRQVDQMLTNDDTTPKVCFIFPKYEGYNADNFELSFNFNGKEGLTKFVIPSNITATGNLETGKKYIITLQLNEAMKFSVVEFKTTDDWNPEIQETDIIM